MSTDATAAQKTARLRFVRRLVLFLAPWLVILAVAAAVLLRTGEALPVRTLLSLQRAAPAGQERLYLRGLMDQGFARYKVEGIRARRPAVLALGSSRVMQVRGDLFPGASFHNAGGLIQGMDDLAAVTAHPVLLEGVTTVVLGVDGWWCNDAWSNPAGFTRMRDGPPDWKAPLAAVRAIVQRPAWLDEKSPGAGHFGLAARRYGAGFRSDGSYYYGLPFPSDGKYVDREGTPIPERVRRGISQFAPATGLSTNALARLDAALAALSKRNIRVLAFAPPLSSDTLAAIEARPDARAFWISFRAEMTARFARAGIAWVDATDLSALGLDDRSLRDGFHAMETFHLHLLPAWSAQRPEDRELRDWAAAARARLADPSTNPWFPAPVKAVP